MSSENEKPLACLIVFDRFNPETKTGTCIGVCKVVPDGPPEDIIHMCIIKAEHKTGKRCQIRRQMSMKPNEAIDIGVALIQASVLGQQFLKQSK